MRYRRQIHHLLHAGRSQHGKTGLASSHHVAVVAENGQGLSGQCTSRYVKYAREQFAGDLVHVGDHQQQSLRSGVGRGERSGLESSVYGTCSTAFGLHLDDFDRFTPEVFLARSGPFVHILGHRGGRRDGINGSQLGKEVRDVRSGVVSVARDEFLFFCHLCIFFNLSFFVLGSHCFPLPGYPSPGEDKKSLISVAIFLECNGRWPWLPSDLPPSPE